MQRATSLASLLILVLVAASSLVWFLVSGVEPGSGLAKPPAGPSQGDPEMASENASQDFPADPSVVRDRDGMPDDPCDFRPYLQDFRIQRQPVLLGPYWTILNRNRRRLWQGGDTALWVGPAPVPDTAPEREASAGVDPALVGVWYYSERTEGSPEEITYNWFKVFRADGTLLEGTGDYQALASTASAGSVPSGVDSLQWCAGAGLLRYRPNGIENWWYEFDYRLEFDGRLVVCDGKSGPERWRKIR